MKCQRHFFSNACSYSIDGQNVTEILAYIIELANSGKAGFTVKQLVALLKADVVQDPTAKGVITYNIGDKECAPQDEDQEDEIGDSGDDALITSSPSKDRASKRRRRNPETESESQHQPEPVSTEATEDTEDEEDEEDTEGSQGINSSSDQAKRVPSIQEYRKRIDADRHPLE
ncbi:hypothetical protein NW758_003781 [Fusarium oxysporum]|nr:hypothetical protein NW758_003781 [Fusarium oxysporum]